MFIYYLFVVVNISKNERGKRSLKLTSIKREIPSPEVIKDLILHVGNMQGSKTNKECANNITVHDMMVVSIYLKGKLDQVESYDVPHLLSDKLTVEKYDELRIDFYPRVKKLLNKYGMEDLIYTNITARIESGDYRRILGFDYHDIKCEDEIGYLERIQNRY